MPPETGYTGLRVIQHSIPQTTHWFFDWSGTLADDRRPVIATTNRILEHHGLAPMTEEEFKLRFRLPYGDFYDEVLPGHDLAELEALYLHYFNQHRDDQVLAIPGAVEFLARCRAAGGKLYVFSSVPQAHWLGQAAAIGVANLFDDCFTGVRDKVERLPQVVRSMALDPRAAIMVGDMVHDIAAGRAAGIASAGVLTGYDPPDRLAGAGADWLVPDLSRLAMLLPSLVGSVPPSVSGVGQPMPPGAGRATGSARADRPISTVGALLYDDGGRVLLVRTAKWSHKWGIPGGKIERGESSEQALRREIQEETGLEIDRIEFVCVQDCVDPPEFHRPAHFLLLNYLARARATAVVLNDEAQDWRWVRLDEALAMDLNEPTRILIEQVRHRLPDARCA